jgi:hypothetical protein
VINNGHRHRNPNYLLLLFLAHKKRDEGARYKVA